jgi:ribonucleoside-triphosphate reductase
MVPDYISEKIMKQQKISKKGEEGDAYPCMGCRSFLTPYRQPKHDEILTFTEDVDLDVE